MAYSTKKKKLKGQKKNLRTTSNHTTRKRVKTDYRAIKLRFIDSV